MKYSFYLVSFLLTFFDSHSVAMEMETEEESISSTRYTGYRPLPLSVLSVVPQVISQKMVIPEEQGLVLNSSDLKGITELDYAQIWPKEYVYDQGDLGSCTANSIAFSIRYLSFANSSAPYKLLNNPEMLSISRLYQYYNTRYYESKIYGKNLIPYDVGASIAGSILALDKYGCCPETIKMKEERIDIPDLKGEFVYTGWPYHIKNYAKQPDPESYRISLDRNWDGLNEGTSFAQIVQKPNPYGIVSQIIQYQDLATPYRKKNGKTVNSVKEKLAFTQKVVKALKSNHPVLAGVMLDDTFNNDHNGYIPTPILKKFEATEGHAFTIVGYGPYNQNNPRQNYFKFINSWGPNWGDNGFGYLEEGYLSNVNIFDVESYEIWFAKGK
jgi:C1A family cysteine protease